MNRRQRLLATLNNQPVDRPPVSFYEINGHDEDPLDHDPFNIYSHPSWLPLIQLARDKTDRMVMRPMKFTSPSPDPIRQLTKTITHTTSNNHLITNTTITLPNRTLTRRTRRDPDVNTTWTEEHLLKNTDDLKAYLEIPIPSFTPIPDTSDIQLTEKQLSDTGIVMIDTGDPLCRAAELFDMGEFTIIAMTEPHLFHQLLQRCAAILYPQIEAFAAAAPGHLWRIVGPEYASPPYLPPHLFKQYVTEYDTQIVTAIHKHQGYARIHSHGNLKDVLPHIVATRCLGLDPVEPPPQGDVELQYVRQQYGEQLILFGNIEASDIETLPPDQFEQKVHTAIIQGTAQPNRGFVLMPSACPYGRILPPLALTNYQTMIRLIEKL